MKLLRLTHMATIAALMVATQSWATYTHTYVESTGTECSSSKLIAAASFGQAPVGTLGPDLDGDGRSGANEDSDNDAIFATITAAVAATSAGGTVDIMGPGLFNESFALASDITIRGPAGGGAIIEPACGMNPGNDGISITGATVVRLENLSIRSFVNGSGVTLDGTTGQFAVLQTCGLERCGTGLSNAGSNAHGAVELHDCHIVSNTGDGILQRGSTSVLSVFDTLIGHNGSSGISLGSEVPWGTVTISRSRIVGNGAIGIKSFVNLTSSSGSLSVHDTDISTNVNEGVKFLATSGNGVATVALSNCVIERNGGDGVQMTNALSRLSLGDNRISQNGGDGIQVSAGLTVDLTKNVISQNAGKGINDATGSTINCTPGFNLVAGNVGGISAVTTNCTNATPAQNNQN